MPIHSDTGQPVYPDGYAEEQRERHDPCALVGLPPPQPSTREERGEMSERGALAHAALREHDRLRRMTAHALRYRQEAREAWADSDEQVRRVIALRGACAELEHGEAAAYALALGHEARIERLEARAKRWKAAAKGNRELMRDRDGDLAHEYGERVRLEALSDAQAARIADLEAERANIAWLLGLSEDATGLDVAVSARLNDAGATAVVRAERIATLEAALRALLDTEHGAGPDAYEQARQQARAMLDGGRQ